jgi:hypothetical protein
MSREGSRIGGFGQRQALGRNLAPGEPGASSDTSPV